MSIVPSSPMRPNNQLLLAITIRIICRNNARLSLEGGGRVQRRFDDKHFEKIMVKKPKAVNKSDATGITPLRKVAIGPYVRHLHQEDLPLLAPSRWAEEYYIASGRKRQTVLVFTRALAIFVKK